MTNFDELLFSLPQQDVDAWDGSTQTDSNFFILVLDRIIELENIIKKTKTEIPEGYQTAKDTLPEQVALMRQGLYAFCEDRGRLKQVIQNLIDNS